MVDPAKVCSVCLGVVLKFTKHILGVTFHLDKTRKSIHGSDINAPLGGLGENPAVIATIFLV